MEERQLREQLRQLEQTIGDLHASRQEKERLSNLIADIERQLNEPLLKLKQPPPNLVDQVKTMVSSFEAEHPTVAGILNNIMITLTSMGV